jgi:hypothetical protein
MKIKTFLTLFGSYFEEKNTPGVLTQAISINIMLPKKNGPQPILICGTITLQSFEDGAQTVINCSGENKIGCWEIAQGIILSEGIIRLSCHDNNIDIRLLGRIKYVNCPDCEIGGNLDTTILYDPDDPYRIYLGTLIHDAYLIVGTSVSLSGGTIKFELCTKPHDSSKPLPYCIDEMDELLFQCTEPLPVGKMHISGIENNPLTLSLSINALSADATQAFISLYPARILMLVFGENTTLFLSGNSQSNTIDINTNGPWSTFVSSSPHMHLVNKQEPLGPPLFDGVSFFTGSLECTGLTKAYLSLVSDLNTVTAFPQSKWPQELPPQRIAFSVSETGEVILVIKFNPIEIENFVIYSPHGNEETIEAALCDDEFYFKEGYLISQKPSDHSPRTLPQFSIDNNCRLRIHTAAGKLDLWEWMKL